MKLTVFLLQSTIFEQIAQAMPHLYCTFTFNYCHPHSLLQYNYYIEGKGSTLSSPIAVVSTDQIVMEICVATDVWPSIYGHIIKQALNNTCHIVPFSREGEMREKRVGSYGLVQPVLFIERNGEVCPLACMYQAPW